MSVKRNLAANFVANAWMASISLLLVPLYVHFIGIESYGLVGIFGTLQAMASVLDFGFTVTINRELARSSAQLAAASDARDLVRTLEVIYWGIAVFLGIVICMLATAISMSWINTVNLPRETVRVALILIGIIITLQWPFGFYAGGLIGLQKQVLLAKINVILATVRGVGAILILRFLSPTVTAFFCWQLLVGTLSTFLVAASLWGKLPKSAIRARFRIGQLKRVWRFSAGVGLVGILGLGLTQMDKVILSRILTLEAFGYYALAGVVCTSLYMLINPVYNAVFPRMTELVVNQDQRALKRLYHQSSELLAALIMPAVVMLVLFSKDIIYAWTGNQTTASCTGSIVAVMAIGTGVHGLAHVPWGLQLAHGWTRLGCGLTIASIILFAPLIIVLTHQYGAFGGATAWALVNIFNLLSNQLLMHRRILKGEMRRWFLVDVGRPAAIAILVAGLGRVIIRDSPSRLRLLIELIIVATGTLLVTAIVVPGSRYWLKSHLAIWRRKKAGAGVKSASAENSLR